jgi:hypothetical protein
MLLSLLWCLLALFCYFIPYLRCKARGGKSSLGVGLLNLFFGWTIIGWFAALIWGVSCETHAEVEARSFDYNRLAAAMCAQADDELKLGKGR